MEKCHETAMEQKVDRKDYSDDELLSIKTKLNLPYYSSSPEFERTYGSVTVDGVVYEYVKKRVYKDTLELLCLPNNAKTALQDVKNNLAKTSAEGQASVPVKKGPATLKISLPDFCQFVETTAVLSVRLNTNYLSQTESFSTSDFTKQQERPPQAI